MASRAKRRVFFKQVAFTMMALLIGAVYAGAMFA
jgi:hypothetical protein